jgi:hypothetical protein
MVPTRIGHFDGQLVRDLTLPILWEALAGDSPRLVGAWPHESIVYRGAHERRPPGTVATTRTRRVLAAAADEWVRLERARIAGDATWAGEVLRPGMRLET